MFFFLHMVLSNTRKVGICLSIYIFMAEHSICYYEQNEATKAAV